MGKMKLIALSGKKRVGKGTVTNMILEEVGKRKRPAPDCDLFKREPAAKAFYDQRSDLDLGELSVTVYQLAKPIKEALFNTVPSKVGYLSYKDFDGEGSVNRDTDVLPLTRTDVQRWFKNAVQWLSANYLAITVDLSEEIAEVVPARKKWTIRDLLTCFGTDLIVNYYDCCYWVMIFGSVFVGELYDSPNRIILVNDVRQEFEMDLMRTLGAEIVHIQRDTGLQDSHSTNKGLPVQEGDTVILNNGTLDELRDQVQKLRSLPNAK